MIAVNGEMKSTRIFHNDISHLCNEISWQYGYDISIMIRFTLYETIIVCFHLASLLHNLTTWVSLVGQL